jgi:hypothetical protein
MKLIKFRVRNYKSVRDSGECWLASDLTVLAGKNESGKSAILEALRDFDRGATIPEAAWPIDLDGAEPMLEATFSVSEAELEEVLAPYPDRLRRVVGAGIARDRGLVLFRRANGEFRFSDPLTEAIAAADAEEAERAARAEAARAEAARHAAEERARLEEASADTEDDDADEEGVDEEDAEEEEDNGSTRGDGSEVVVEGPEPLLERVVNELPRFVFFSSFEEMLPFEITFTRARQNPAVQDFARVAGLDLVSVAKLTDIQQRKNLLASRSARISGDFRRFWHQDSITLSASAEGQTLILGIQEDQQTHTFKFEQRSKGFQWFLSFYLRLNAHQAENRVILIDEPGLYLHARAQEDVLSVLEDIAADAPVIFSTHSPYLIDANRLDRVRLVTKSADGTKIQGKVHAEADAETMTPIITAVGLDARRHFTVAGRKNVLLEGITDYFYLNAFRRLAPADASDGLSLIPAVGAQNVPKLASLLIGWNLDFVAVLDHEREGKSVARTLTEELSVPPERVVFSSPTDGESIEDLMTRTEFNRYVLPQGTQRAPDAPNSKVIKSARLDSVLLARQFFTRASEPGSVKLGEATLKRINRLLEAITANFAG